MTLNELESFLDSHGVPFPIWGKVNCKTVHDLHHEIESGESFLTVIDDRPTRVIRVSSVLIYAFTHAKGSAGSGWHVLKEDAHVLQNGYRLERWHLPNSVSEKLRRGESAEAAAHRALREELGWVDQTFYRLYRHSTITNRNCIALPSYVGLHTKVTEQITWKCVIRKELFRPEGYTIRLNNKTLHFHWEMLMHQPDLVFPEDEHHRTRHD